MLVSKICIFQELISLDQLGLLLLTLLGVLCIFSLSAFLLYNLSTQLLSKGDPERQAILLLGDPGKEEDIHSVATISSFREMQEGREIFTINNEETYSVKY